MAKRRARKAKENFQSKSKSKPVAAGGDASKHNYVKYSASHATLVVGDGNFSFSRGLITALGTGSNVTATSYDSLADVLKKYGSKALVCIEACKAAGAGVKHGVDATRLQSHFAEPAFQRIIFNFPHTGQQRVHNNRNLICGFFTSARPLLTTGGELHITLKLQPPYSAWGVPDMAREAGYVHFTTRDFDFAAFPGYTHKTTEAGATELDTSSEDAKRAIKTLVFRRIAGPAPGGAANEAAGAGAAAAQAAASAQPAAGSATGPGKHTGPPEKQGMSTAAAGGGGGGGGGGARQRPAMKGTAKALKATAAVMKKVAPAKVAAATARSKAPTAKVQKGKKLSKAQPAAVSVTPAMDGKGKANAASPTASPAAKGSGGKAGAAADNSHSEMAAAAAAAKSKPNGSCKGSKVATAATHAKKNKKKINKGKAKAKPKQPPQQGKVPAVTEKQGKQKER